MEKYSLPVSGVVEKYTLGFVRGSFEKRSSAVKGFFSSAFSPVSTPGADAFVASGFWKSQMIGRSGTPDALPASSHMRIKDSELWRKTVLVSPSSVLSNGGFNGCSVGLTTPAWEPRMILPGLWDNRRKMRVATLS